MTSAPSAGRLLKVAPPGSPGASTHPPKAALPVHRPAQDGSAAATRRSLLACGAAFAGLAGTIDGPTFAWRSAAAAVPATPHDLIVAGPEGGPLAGWAQTTASVMEALLPPGSRLRVAYVGGIDGVTAANQFEARAAPDGATALLVTGAAALAWLVGDPRAQFDVGRWLPVATATSSGIILANRPDPTRPDSIQAAAVRMVCTTSRDSSLAATLGLSLLGIETASVSTTPNALAALLSGQADVAFIHGPDAGDAARQAADTKATPLFSLGAYDDAGQFGRDPNFPTVPTLIERLAAKPTVDQALLARAWQAVATAIQLDFALILPALTPAGAVAWWRKGGAQITATGTNTASLSNGRSVVLEANQHRDPSFRFDIANVTLDAVSSLALRRWITSRPR